MLAVGVDNRAYEEEAISEAKATTLKRLLTVTPQSIKCLLQVSYLLQQRKSLLFSFLHRQSTAHSPRVSVLPRRVVAVLLQNLQTINVECITAKRGTLPAL